MGGLTVAELESRIRADQRRYNRFLRTLAQLIHELPLAVSTGIVIALSDDKKPDARQKVKKALREWHPRKVLKRFADYAPGAEPVPQKEQDEE